MFSSNERRVVFDHLLCNRPSVQFTVPPKLFIAFQIHALTDVVFLDSVRREAKGNCLCRSGMPLVLSIQSWEQGATRARKCSCNPDWGRRAATDFRWTHLVYVYPFNRNIRACRVREYALRGTRMRRLQAGLAK